jgi:hypothetical protein
MSLTPDEASIQFPVLVPTLQIGFYAKFVEAQKEYLLTALLNLVNHLEINRLDQELSLFAGEAKLRYLAKYGLRGELLYPVPYLLIEKPRLLGYYRLFLGFSQKEFYNSGPFGLFSRMESQNIISPKSMPFLPALCSSLIESSWILVNGLPVLSQEILNALTLLTLGGQLRGSYNTLLGQNATKSVFDTIKEIVKPAIERR